MWVSSHGGIPGNKKADAMVDEAVTSESILFIIQYTTKHLINEAHKRTLTSWQN